MDEAPQAMAPPSPFTAAVLRMAEDPLSVGGTSPGSRLVTDDKFLLWFAPPIYPGLSVVQRVRASDHDLAEAVERVRRLVAGDGRSRTEWMVGWSATPSDASHRLLRLGLTETEEPLTAMVADRAPAEPPAGVEVRPVASAQDMVTFMRVQHTAFGADEATVKGSEEAARAHWEAQRSWDHAVRYLAFVDGEPAAAGQATFLPAGVQLNGGSTVPHLRGRGAYRALVAARWQEAVRRGTPVLTTQARPAARPILERLGFQPVGDIRMLADQL
ncbi:MAG TPA: hypothetical protein VNE62_00730 [Actinomycetota bacterium]|nr:hypothetical protein [Actinomycetota bacterium]